MATEDASAPAGWYADPSGQPGHRWWDGQLWHPRTDEAASLPHKWLTTSGGTRLVLASWWRRAAGLMIDGVIVYVVASVVQVASGLIFSSSAWAFGLYGHQATLSPGVRVGVTILIAVSNLVYAAVFLGHWGQTLGMMAVRARALDLQSGGPLPRAKAWLRQATIFALGSPWTTAAFAMDAYIHHTKKDPPGTLIAVVGVILTGVAYLWPLGNAANQTLQDKAAGSVVVLDDTHEIKVSDTGTS
jgi:uncharacterized RDD family membrane protein YckC